MSQAALDAFRRLPQTFLANLTAAERMITLNVFLYLDFASKGTKTPRQLQILAALAVSKGKDLLVRSGTGSGKTLAMIIPVLLLDKNAVAITISPLRLIQDNHVSEFANYGIPSIAINCFTPDDPALWTSLRDHKIYRHYSVSPEQCGPYQGHIPKFAKLLRDPKWSKAVKLLQIDEAHFIVTTGQSKGKEGAFRPAFSDLGERVRVHLPSDAVCTAYSASMPTRVSNVLIKTLRMDPENTVKLELSTNRPNLIHAAIPMIGTINDFTQIYTSSSPSPRNASPLLSPELAGKKPFRHFHSSMSKAYLEDTIAAFKNGDVSVLIATESASNGFDVPDISLIVLYGVPKSMYEEDQRGGRGGRDGRECLLLTIAEEWVLKNLAATDPDHDPGKKELRTETAEEPSYDSDSDCDQPKKRKRKRYRPVALREPLVSELEEWRQKAHAADPIAKDFPISYIMDDKAISLLARELSGTFRIPGDITSFLGETLELHAQYALAILGTIRLHDSDGYISSSESDGSGKEKLSESDSDTDEIRRPSAEDTAANVGPSSPDPTPPLTRSNTPDPIVPPAPAFTSSGRPLRQAAIHHIVTGIAEQVNKRRKVADEGVDEG
ncbi:hypothetical protein B0H19DRAFT_1256360 [Mycena capillaripes]|nr:hypothetical protein B0H19DRAFT_1256360 [Mycena capillaripes]